MQASLVASPAELALVRARLRQRHAERATAGALASPYLTDPAGWIKDRLGEHVWSKQAQIAQTLVTNRRVAVHSCHGSGKSFLASRLVAWWLDTHPPGDAFVVTTAPTTQQVKGVLWREIGRAHRKGNLAGRTNLTEWYIDNELVAFGRKPADYDPTAFQGIHARNVLVIFDEACGIPEEIFQAGQSLAANEESRLLAIGNPDDPQAHFERICRPGSNWATIGISAFDTPNFTGEAIPDGLRALLVSHIYERELREDVGEDSPVYKSKILGQFPDDNPSGVIPLSFIRACQRLEEEWAPDQLLPVELGVDVGAGGDETVIRERRGVLVGRSWRYLTPSSTEAVGYVMEAIKATGATRVKIDTIGVGWGVVGRLQELKQDGKHGAEVMPVNVGEKSADPTRFPKLRDQIWWEIGRKLSEQHAWDLSGLDETTVGQLIAPQWRPDSAGRHQIEPKRETKKRIGRSPDDADALLLAYYVPAPKPLVLGVVSMARAKDSRVTRVGR